MNVGKYLSGESQSPTTQRITYRLGAALNDDGNSVAVAVARQDGENITFVLNGQIDLLQLKQRDVLLTGGDSR